jgi:hypothetical protein
VTKTVLGFISKSEWPAIVVLLLLLFQKQIIAFIERLAQKVTDATEVSGEAGPVKFKIAAEIKESLTVLRAEEMQPPLSDGAVEGIIADRINDRASIEAQSKVLLDMYDEIGSALRARVVELRGGVAVPVDYDAQAAAAVLQFNGLLDAEIAKAINLLQTVCRAIEYGSAANIGAKSIEESVTLAATVLATLDKA